jgi:very-short-patch-repair endonuclease
MMFCKLIKQETGFKVVKEFKFNPDRRWRSDYYIPELKLLIEQEGGVYTGQAHGSISGILRDVEKYDSATCLGYRIIRVLPKDLMTQKTIDMIKTISKL